MNMMYQCANCEGSGYFDLPDDTEKVCSVCGGAGEVDYDAAIARAAHQLGWCSLVMPAQWQQHGRAAGPIRNRELLQQAIARAVAHSSPGSMASVLVVAFPGGAGTASLVQQARRLAFRSPVPIAVVEVSPSAGLWAVPFQELPPGA
jgi:hypothetical protein